MLGLTNFISTCFAILLRQITKPDTLTLLFILLFFFFIIYRLMKVDLDLRYVLKEILA